MRSFVIGLLLSVAACGGSSGSDVQAPEPTPAPAPTTPPTETTPPAAPLGTYFPPAGDAGAWDAIDPAAAHFDATKLDALSSFVETTGATSFMVVYDGRILVEKYWGGTTATTLRDIASAQKSIVSLLVGVAIAKGLLHMDDTVSSILGDGWSNGTPADEAGITIRHLVTMTSGLDESLQHDAAPGTKWLYNTDAYHRLELVLETKTGKELQDLTRIGLFDAIGIGSSAWAKRPFAKDSKGVPVSALEMNAHDMARVGLVVMTNGNWNGTNVVPPAYLASALVTSQTFNPSYGFLFWLNGQASALLPPSQPVSGALMPSGPADIVAALGANDQKIYVSRSEKLVITRQGPKATATDGTQALSSWDDQLWQHVMAAKKVD